MPSVALSKGFSTIKLMLTDSISLHYGDVVVLYCNDCRLWSLAIIFYLLCFTVAYIGTNTGLNV